AKRPTAPANLVVTAVATDMIDVSWSDRSSNETGFDINRCIGAGCSSSLSSSFSLLVQVIANTTHVTDSGLNAATTYCYEVRARNGGWTSAWTSAKCAITLT